VATIVTRWNGLDVLREAILLVFRKTVVSLLHRHLLKPGAEEIMV
jgi:hypothetical protein